MPESQELVLARLRVIQLREEGKSYADISKLTQMPKTTVYNIAMKWIKNETVHNLPRPGRPRKTSAQDDRRIVRTMASTEDASARKMANISEEMLGVRVSATTIRKRMRENDFITRMTVYKPKLTPEHKAARLEFAKTFQHAPSDYWDAVIWSDECKFYFKQPKLRRRLWLKEGHGRTSPPVRERVKFGGGSIMVWGAITSRGTCAMAVISGKMTAESYVDILRANLLPQLARMDGAGTEVQPIFQQDNDPKHTSKHAKAFFDSNGVTVLGWPANSPDLNPIEHVWPVMKAYLGGKECKNAVECEAAVREAWEVISPAFCKKLVATMPARIQEVLNAKGDHTRY